MHTLLLLMTLAQQPVQIIEPKSNQITDPQVLSRMLAAARIQNRQINAQARMMAAKIQSDEAEKAFNKAKQDLEAAQRDYINLRNSWPGNDCGGGVKGEINEEQKLVCPSK